ncbi:thymidylate synthase [Candidatus Saccharibacteria bacterium]|nr:thymidylate synthase [Candidatus Saccharibacteria bacterium]
MNKFDEKYIDLCRRILKEGEEITNYAKTDQRKKSDASAMPFHKAQGEQGSETIRLPHQIFQFDLEEGFPILTSKKVAFKTSVLELLWIFQVASNDVRWLKERGVKIWDEWEISEKGIYQGRNINQIFQKNHQNEPKTDFAHTIGTAYGWIVSRYNLVENLIATLKNTPGNRRMVLSLWQNEWLETAALPSCVWNSEWNLTNGRLNLLVNSRSSDVPLGLPFNIVQYAIFDYLIARTIGAKPGLFTFITNDAHIYKNQIPGIKEQIRRYDEAVKTHTLPKPPKLWLNPEINDFYAFDNSKDLKDIKLIDYNHLGAIKMPVTE